MANFTFSLLCGLLVTISVALISPQLIFAAGKGFWSAQGGKLVDSEGKNVRITGINYGFEVYDVDPTKATLDGDKFASYQDIIKSIKEFGFNAIRLTWRYEHLQSSCRYPTKARKNPSLSGMSCVKVLDALVEEAKKNNLKVILDHHTIDGGPYGGVHYNIWLQNWKLLAQRYKGNDTVIGADLNNEPTGCWGCGNRLTDVKLAFETAGNAIHVINPHWLIFAEPPGYIKLTTIKNKPLNLVTPHKLVYSVHDYSGTHYNSSDWNADFEEWWGFMAKQGIPVFIGEFQITSKYHMNWMKDITSYMRTNNISGAVWAWRYIDPSYEGQTWYTVTQIEPDYLTMVDDERQSILKKWFSPSPSGPGNPPPGEKTADSDNDGKVNNVDLDNYWLPFYNKHGNDGTVPNGKIDGDYNGDGKVDGLDYMIWYTEYDV